MIKNTTHSSIGCNGMANNDGYHGLEMYKNHAKDSTTEGYMQPDPTNMECMWPNQSLKGQGMNAWNFGGRRNVRTIILTLICHYSGMNGKVVFSIPFLLDQEVILLRHSLLMDQDPVFLPMEPRLAPYGRPL